MVPLAALLDDIDPTVRSSARNALKRIAPPGKNR